MIEVRQPGEEHRDQVSEAITISLDLDRRHADGRAERLLLHHFRCAFEGDRVLATAAAWPFRQWFGGRELRMTGIYAVTTLPEYRAAGLASRTTEQLLHEGRERGVPLSALYPATLRPYRRLGFELAGTFTEHTAPFDALPEASGPLAVEEYRPEDLEGVRACYRRWAAGSNGPIDAEDEAWWPTRVLGSSDPSAIHRVAVVRDDSGTVRGYVTCRKEPETGDFRASFRLACEHFVACDPEALSSLLGYVRGFRGLGVSLTIVGAPADPLGLVLAERRLRPTRTMRWMLRLLDVPRALEQRGYPPVSGAATIAVEDPTFADNRGPWRIEADAGSVTVTRTRSSDRRPLHIRTLSSLFSGYLSAHDAVHLGLLEADDPAVALLATLFAGPAPFMLDFF
ncbi:MAG TPA: GNAT family N-acetyltransferase [Actinomycetota bacterium]|nr:GNAT family N-acetyltransferase [Actinomycetota bacterium]